MVALVHHTNPPRQDLGAQQLEGLHRAYSAQPSPELCRRLVEAYEGLATQLARRFAHRGESFEDLRQTALLALVAAIEGFDPDRGVRFASYAIPTIAGQLKRHLRDRGWLVRPPRRLQELYLRVYGVLEELEQDLARRPVPGEIAQRLGTSTEEVLEALEAAGGRRGVALDAPVRPQGGTSFAATLGGDDADLARADDALTVAELVRRLPERERHVIRLSFFEGLTQQQIASQMGKTQTHVSRTIARALGRMRCYSDEPAAARPADARRRPEQRVRPEPPPGPVSRDDHHGAVTDDDEVRLDDDSRPVDFLHHLGLDRPPSDEHGPHHVVVR